MWTPRQQHLIETNPEKYTVGKRKRRKKNRAAKAARKRNRG